MEEEIDDVTNSLFKGINLFPGHMVRGIVSFHNRICHECLYENILFFSEHGDWIDRAGAMSVFDKIKY